MDSTLQKSASDRNDNAYKKTTQKYTTICQSKWGIWETVKQRVSMPMISSKCAACHNTLRWCDGRLPISKPSGRTNRKEANSKTYMQERAKQSKNTKHPNATYKRTNAKNSTTDLSAKQKGI